MDTFIVKFWGIAAAAMLIVGLTTGCRTVEEPGAVVNNDTEVSEVTPSNDSTSVDDDLYGTSFNGKPGTDTGTGIIIEYDGGVGFGY